MGNYEDYTKEDFEEMSVDELWGFILYYNIASEDVMQYATGIHGYTTEELNNVISYYTGYNDASQYYACAVHNNASYFEELKEE